MSALPAPQHRKFVVQPVPAEGEIMSSGSGRDTRGRQHLAAVGVRTEGSTPSHTCSVHASETTEPHKPQNPRKRVTFSPEIWGARMIVAQDFNEILEEYRADRDDRYSNAALARLLGVSEREIRFYRTGERALPFGIQELLPWPIVRRLRKKSDERRERRGGM